MKQENALQAAVLAELRWEPSVKAEHITVEAHDGIVTLTGHVGTYLERCGVETAVRGVNAAVEEIDVRLAHHLRRTDEAIAAAAISRLAWDVSVPPDAVKVTVESGVLTLTGVVDWQYQRAAAEQDVRALAGIACVSNQISIQQDASASIISDDISWHLAGPGSSNLERST